MRKLALVLLFLLPLSSAYAEDIGNNTVCFVPGPDDCASVAAREIAKAQHTIEIQAYGFTEPQIAQALLDAHAKGVQVRLISDKSAPKERNGKTEVLAMAGIPVWIDYVPRIAHNKVMIIDGQVTLTGSLNWTVAADRHNAENLIIIRDTATASAYSKNFESRLAASQTLSDYEQLHSR